MVSIRIVAGAALGTSTGGRVGTGLLRYPMRRGVTESYGRLDRLLAERVETP